MTEGHTIARIVTKDTHERPIAWIDVKTLRRSVASAFAYTMAYLMKLLMRQAMFGLWSQTPGFCPMKGLEVGSPMHLNHHKKRYMKLKNAVSMKLLAGVCLAVL